MLKQNQNKDLYYVAVKLLIRDNNKLLIIHDIFGDWDLPGGRIRVNEFDKPLEAVIERKITEELGSDIKYTVNKPVVFFRVERKEHDSKEQNARIFAVGYEAKYKNGEIRLGNHHNKYEWVEINTFKPEEYFKNGWLAGIKDYLIKIKRDSE